MTALEEEMAAATVEEKNDNDEEEVDDAEKDDGEVPAAAAKKKKKKKSECLCLFANSFGLTGCCLRRLSLKMHIISLCKEQISAKVMLCKIGYPHQHHTHTLTIINLSPFSHTMLISS